MDVLCDTNVILTTLTGRDDPFLNACDTVFRLAAAERFRAWIAFHSLSILWYVLRKKKSEQETRLLMETVCNTFAVAAASHAQVACAVQNRSFRDFEDCLQDECAQAVNAQYLITCNLRDFSGSKTPALTPDSFLEMIQQSIP